MTLESCCFAAAGMDVLSLQIVLWINVIAAPAIEHDCVRAAESCPMVIAHNIASRNYNSCKTVHLICARIAVRTERLLCQSHQPPSCLLNISHVLLERLHQGRLGDCSNDSLHFLSVLEDHDGGDAANAVLRSDLGTFIRVQFELQHTQSQSCVYFRTVRTPRFSGFCLSSY